MIITIFPGEIFPDLSKIERSDADVMVTVKCVRCRYELTTNRPNPYVHIVDNIMICPLTIKIPGDVCEGDNCVCTVANIVEQTI